MQQDLFLPKPLPCPAWVRRHPGLRAVLTVLGLFVCALALALVFQNGSTYATGIWDDYSQQLVFGRMIQMQQGQASPGGFLGVYTQDWGDSQNRYWYRDNAALDPAVAAKKLGRESSVAGQANILVFPELNAANIAVKLIQRFGHGKGYGHTLSGFQKPVADSSRGSSVEEMTGDIAMVVIAAANQ